MVLMFFNQRNIGNDFVCVPIMVVLKDPVWKNKCYESQIWLKCNLDQWMDLKVSIFYYSHLQMEL